MNTRTAPWVLPVVRASWRDMDAAPLIGAPAGVARRWQKVRYDMTVGLKRRVAEDVN